MNIWKVFFISCLLFSLLSCKNSQSSTKSVNELSEQSNEIQGWINEPNNSGDYILYIEEKEDVQNPKLKRDFYVVDNGGNRVYDNSIAGGYVKWLDDTKVEYFSPPGVMPPNTTKDDFIMIYDLVTKKSYKKSSAKL